MELADINQIVRDSSLKIPFSTLAPVFDDADETLARELGTNCVGHAKLLASKIPGAKIINSSNITHSAVVITLDGKKFFADTSLGMSSAVEISEGKKEAETILGNSTLSCDSKGFEYVLRRAAVDFSPRTWVFPNDGTAKTDARFIKRDWLDFLVYSDDGARQIYIRRYTGQLKWEARSIDKNGVSFAGNSGAFDEFFTKASELASISKEDLKETFERGVSLYHYGQAMFKLGKAL